MISTSPSRDQTLRKSIVEENSKITDTEKLRRVIKKNKSEYETENQMKSTPVRLANVPDSDDECYFWKRL